MNNTVLTSTSRVFIFALISLLAGCASLPTEKRHTPAEIAAYQLTDFIATIASTAGEQAEYANALKSIHDAVAANTNEAIIATAPSALWAVQFLNVERDAGREILLRALPLTPSQSIDFQRDILSAAYTLYAKESQSLVSELLPQIATPRQFAIAAYALLAADSSETTKNFIRDTMRSRFTDTRNAQDWKTEPRLVALGHVIDVDMLAERRARPPLVDLLAASFVPAAIPNNTERKGLPVVFSFQRHDRKHFGLAVVRGADGKFVRNADGTIFHIPHLANALTNLPGTITNGNTPQGLFTITGAGTATNKWIGPTPYLESKIPIEGSLADFTHAENKNIWTEDAYEAFLPEKWRQYTPFKEAYLAGLAGRDDMLMHGTTINAEYYRGQSYYPGTPSAGCLVAEETWSKDEGRLQTSNQLALIKAFTRDGVDRGHLVVVELDDGLMAVSLDDVLKDLLKAER